MMLMNSSSLMSPDVATSKGASGSAAIERLRKTMQPSPTKEDSLILSQASILIQVKLLICMRSFRLNFALAGILGRPQPLTA